MQHQPELLEFMRRKGVRVVFIARYDPGNAPIERAFSEVSSIWMVQTSRIQAARLRFAGEEIPAVQLVLPTVYSKVCSLTQKAYDVLNSVLGRSHWVV